jgi:hypothetical protein
VQTAWETLIAAGVPDGAPRPAPRAIDFEALRRSISALDVDALDDVECAVLLAWLEAFRHHWPSRFERELGDAGRALLAEVGGRRIDTNRYLKLRRIALANLAGAI